MKCPKCGLEIKDGNLICENCGYEVRIVPDYDPDTDLEIEESIIDGESDKLTAETYESLMMDTSTEPLLDMKSVRTRALVIACIIACAVIGVVFIVFAIIKTNSLDYKLNRVKAEAGNGRYEEAIDELENLYVHYPDESQIFFLEADYYTEMGKSELAEDTLMRMIDSDSFEEDELFQAYDRLIAVYDGEQDYQKINDLLSDCPYESIVTSYQNYMAIAPTFSPQGGEYEDVVRLKLSANTSGTIYYTLDGSVPNETSDVYGGVIVLDSGEVTVSAVFVNQYGIVSDVVSQDYVISVSTPDAPEVNYDTGSYDTPILIEVTVPEDTTVYYTTDKSVPTIDSIQYTGPIPIPLNTSNFNFVAINDQGISSEVVTRSYTLSFPGGLSTDDAINALKTRFIEKGLLTDMSGKSSRAPGVYTYTATSAIRIEGQGDYYIVREIYHDESGNTTTSDTTYIVEIYQGSVAVLGGDAVNGFIALAF